MKRNENRELELDLLYNASLPDDDGDHMKRVISRYGLTKVKRKIAWLIRKKYLRRENGKLTLTEAGEELQVKEGLWKK